MQAADPAEFFVSFEDRELAEAYAARLRALEMKLSTFLKPVNWQKARGTPKFDFMSRQLDVPDSKIGGRIETSVAVFTHEVTHAFFEDYLDETCGSWRLFNREFPELNAKFAYLRDQTESFIERGESTDGLFAEMKVLARKQNAAFLRAIDLSSYSEFVADLAAVLAAGDPNALVSAVRSFTPGLSPSEWRSRSFRPDLNDLRGWQVDPYTAFLPTRIWLGRMPLLESAGRDPHFLLQVFEVLRLCIEEQILSPARDATEMNQRLQSRLEDLFRRLPNSAP